MSKSQGTASEILFRYICLKKDVVPSIPDIDDGCGFDVITSYDGRLLKIQVKSTNYVEGNYYRVNVSHGTAKKKKYTKDQCDIMAVHIVSLDLWYLIPIEEIKSMNVKLYPEKLNHRYSKYKSAWHLLAS
jgi:hypothetical protein